MADDDFGDDVSEDDEVDYIGDMALNKHRMDSRRKLELLLEMKQLKRELGEDDYGY